MSHPGSDQSRYEQGNTLFLIKGMDMNCQKCKTEGLWEQENMPILWRTSGSTASSKKISTMPNGNGYNIQGEKVDIMDPLAFLGNKRSKVEESFLREQNEITIQDDSRIVDYPFNGTADKQSVLSIDNALSLLAGIRDSYKQRRIKPQIS